VNAQAILTTPGAGKWYRSVGPKARQSIQFTAGAGACLEWLPQENIIFTGAHAELRTVVQLSGDASYIGWDITCLGRGGSGETFAAGSYRARTLIERGNRPVWFENARLEGTAAALQSPAVLAGRPVVATLLAVSDKLDSTVLHMCRSVQPMTGDGAVTLLPGIIVARYLGGSSEAAKHYFVKLWHVVRPVVADREAVQLRIWQT
jgi:urease accessory protein